MVDRLSPAFENNHSSMALGSITSASLIIQQHELIRVPALWHRIRHKTVACAHIQRVFVGAVFDSWPRSSETRLECIIASAANRPHSLITDVI
jgi:hypothetical protein